MQVKHVTLWGLFIGIFLALLSSCAAFEDPSKRATENAQSTALWTRVYDLETQQATIAALRLTAESANNMATQLANANGQINMLRATTAAQPRPLGTTVPGIPTAIGGGVPAGAFPSPSPLPSSGTTYAQTTTATGTDSDGCATQAQNIFTPDSEAIYFVTRALNLLPGTTFSLRITTNGRIVAADPNFWTSDTSYDDTCIWYNIDQETLPFVAGTYAVELLANNIVATSATFVIAGGETAPAATEEVTS